MHALFLELALAFVEFLAISVLLNHYMVRGERTNDLHKRM
jgi:hypothetical protein